MQQYIEFSSCHPLSCKRYSILPSKTISTYSSDDDCFKQDLSRLETYFKGRNYPIDILTEALPRASYLTIEEALQSSSSERNNQDVITFVCTYNPSLPNIG